MTTRAAPSPLGSREEGDDVTLTDEAKKAYEADVAADAAVSEVERKVLRQAATDAAKQVLTRPDGSTLTLAETGLSAVHSDLSVGVVVWSDGTLSLAAQLLEGAWVVRLVEKVDGEWTALSDELRSLADLGAALVAD